MQGMSGQATWTPDTAPALTYNQYMPELIV